MSILNTGLTAFSDTAFLMKGRDISHALTHPPGSTYFPAVQPSPAALDTALDAFEQALLLGNAPGAASDRAKARDAAGQIIKAIAADLQNTTTDRTRLAHTGYTLRKAMERHTTPTGTPQNVGVKHTGHRGEARITATTVPKARIYEARATQDPASGIFTNCTPSTSIRGLRFVGLERGKDWFFQIRAISVNGPGPWSDPAMMMVV